MNQNSTGLSLTRTLMAALFLILIFPAGLSSEEGTRTAETADDDSIVSIDETRDGVIPMDQKGVVSLALQNADVATVMKGISQLGNYDFVTKGEIEKNVNLTLKDRSIREALDIISDSTGTEYRLNGTIITVFGEEQDPSYTKTYQVLKGNTNTITQVLKDLVGASVSTQTETLRREDGSSSQTTTQAPVEIKKGQAKIVKDKLNSQIVITAYPSDHRKIQKVWDVVDVDVSRRRFKTQMFELKFITPELFVRSILFLIPGIEPSQIFSFANTGGGGAEAGGGEGGGGGGGGGGGAGGGTTLSASLKRVIIQETDSNLKRIEDLLDEIDLPPRQVVIDVKMVEFTLNKDEKLGIDWKTIFTQSGRSLPVGEFFSPLSSQGTGRLKFGSLGPDHLQIVLDFIQGNSSAKILSNPQLTVLDGSTATLEVADDIPYRTSTVSQGTIVEAVAFAKSGVTLEVTPIIFKNEFVNLVITPEITNRNGDFDGIPIISTKSTETALNIRNNHTVIMGGLISHTKTIEKNSIPIIGNLPGVGKLFQSNSESFRANELVFFITPKIYSEFATHPHDDLKYKFQDSNSTNPAPFQFVDQGQQTKDYKEFLKRNRL